MSKEPEKTTPDAIPSVDIIAAAAREDVKEAQDLLAGFNKPQRGLQRPQGADFVSYYANKPMSQPLEPSAARAQEKAERNAKTEVHRIPPHVVGRGMSKGTAWFLAGGAMLAIGGGVMWLALYVLPAPTTPSLAPLPAPSTTAPVVVATTTVQPVVTATATSVPTATEIAPIVVVPPKAAPATRHPAKGSPAASARNDSAGVL